MKRMGGRGWEEEGSSKSPNPNPPSGVAAPHKAKDAMREKGEVAAGVGEGAPSPDASIRTSCPKAPIFGARRSRLLSLEWEDGEGSTEDEVIGVQSGSCNTPLYSPSFSAKVVLSPAQQRRLMWTPERTPRSRKAHRQRRRYHELHVSRRPWAMFWAVLLLSLLLALPLLHAWRRLWSSHRIGIQAAFVCVVSHFFPLVDHSDDFADLERLAWSRRRLDLANHLNMAPTIAGTEDILVPSSKGDHDIPVRLFRPLVAADASKRNSSSGSLSKLLVWIHGGGWTIGSIASDDKIARRLASATGAVVASVEYRLAPEFKYPAQVDDTMDALEFLLERGQDFGLDTRKVAVAGESAGGHLTIASAMALGAAKTRLCGILPVVPATDYGCESASCERFHEGFLLTQKQVRAFWNAKLSNPTEEQDHFLVSPLRAPQEVFENMPPMLVMTAGLDPLRDEGEAFADRARKAGAVVDLVRFENTIHGFFGRMVTGGASGVALAATWLERTCDWGADDEEAL